MISFALTDEQAIVRSTFRSFAERAVAPHSRSVDEAGRLPETLLSALLETGVVQAQIDSSGDEGLAFSNALILEELGAADAGCAALLAGLLGFAGAISRTATSEQQALVAERSPGSPMGAICLIEPRFPFHPGKLETSARREGSRYLLAGRKFAVPLVRSLHWLLVVASLDGVPAAFLVPADAPGLEIRPAPGSLALRGLELTELELDGVCVPREYRLGDDAGWDHAQALARSRVALASILTGQARAALDYAIPYVKDRKAHGSALGRKQAVAFRLADAHIHVQAMRWLAWRAATELDQQRDATRSALLAFQFAARRGLQTTDDTLQMFGGSGFTRELPLELWYRSARTLALLDGFGGL